MNDFSSVVITTDGGSECANADVADGPQQTMRRLLVTCWYFLVRYRRGGGAIDAEMRRIAKDIRNQAADLAAEVEGEGHER